MTSPSTLRDVPSDGETRSLVGRRIGFGVLALIVAAGLAGLLGDRMGTVAIDAPGGHHVQVEYAETSRPGQDVPFQIEVSKDGGLDPEVTLAISAEYLLLYEAQGWYPEPSEQTRDADWLYLTFTTDGARSLVIDFDGYIQPDVARGGDGQVALVVDGMPTAPVSFHTTLFP